MLDVLLWLPRSNGQAVVIDPTQSRLQKVIYDEWEKKFYEYTLVYLDQVTSRDRVYLNLCWPWRFWSGLWRQNLLPKHVLWRARSKGKWTGSKRRNLIHQKSVQLRHGTDRRRHRYVEQRLSQCCGNIKGVSFFFTSCVSKLTPQKRALFTCQLAWLRNCDGPHLF